MAGGVEGKAAPAAADFEDLLAWLEFEFTAETVVFVFLGFGERLVLFGEECAGVSEGVVEPEGIELVGEVVVFADIAAGIGGGVAAAPMGEAIESLEDVEGKGSAPGAAGHTGDGFEVSDEGGDEAGEIRSGPIALHVGFAEADFALEEDASEEAGVVDTEFGGFGGGIGATGEVLLAVGEEEAHRCAIETPEHTQDSVGGEAVEPCRLRRGQVGLERCGLGGGILHDSSEEDWCFLGRIPFWRSGRDFFRKNGTFFK